MFQRFQKDIIKRCRALHQRASVNIQTGPIDKTVLDAIRAEMSSSNRFTLPELGGFLDDVRLHTVVTVTAGGVGTTTTTTPVIINIVARTPADIPPELLLERVALRICVVKDYLEIARDTLIYWLIPCTTARTYPEASQHVSPKHINGGYTYVTHPCTITGVCPHTPRSNIYVYRYQEFPKVMLHETIHQSRLDTSSHGIWTSEVINNLKKLCNISSETTLLPNEAIVETWATLFQIVFLSLHYVPVKTALSLEQDWGNKQASRIIESTTRKPWIEESNAYCYVVIKSALLHNPDEFIGARASANIVEYVFRALRDKTYIEKRAATPKIKTNCFRMTLLGDL